MNAGPTCKGLEADVVFLIGLRESKVCTSADVYVGASRAKFLLYVFHHSDWDFGKHCEAETLSPWLEENAARLGVI